MPAPAVRLPLEKFMKLLAEDIAYLFRHYFCYVLRHGHYKPRR